MISFKALVVASIMGSVQGHQGPAEDALNLGAYQYSVGAFTVTAGAAALNGYTDIKYWKGWGPGVPVVADQVAWPYCAAQALALKYPEYVKAGAEVGKKLLEYYKKNADKWEADPNTGVIKNPVTSAATVLASLKNPDHKEYWQGWIKDGAPMVDCVNAVEPANKLQPSEDDCVKAAKCWTEIPFLGGSGSGNGNGSGKEPEKSDAEYEAIFYTAVGFVNGLGATLKATPEYSDKVEIWSVKTVEKTAACNAAYGVLVKPKSQFVAANVKMGKLQVKWNEKYLKEHTEKTAAKDKPYLEKWIKNTNLAVVCVNNLWEKKEGAPKDEECAQMSLCWQKAYDAWGVGGSNSSCIVIIVIASVVVLAVVAVLVMMFCCKSRGGDDDDDDL